MSSNQDTISVVPRSQKYSAPILFSAPKLVGALIHLLIGPTIRLLLQADAGGWFLRSITASIGMESFNFVTRIEGDRLEFYTLFTSFYGIRWAIGMFTANGGGQVPWSAALQIPLLHLILMAAFPFTILAVGLDSELGTLDYVAGVLALIAGICQHGAEGQRLLFKLQPTNKGKLHTTGLFGLARYINHFGHVLQEVAVVLATKSWIYAVFTIIAAKFVLFSLVPELEAHLQEKYGDQYEKYVQKTPYKFIPFVY